MGIRSLPAQNELDSGVNGVTAKVKSERKLPPQRTGAKKDLKANAEEKELAMNEKTKKCLLLEVSEAEEKISDPLKKALVFSYIANDLAKIGYTKNALEVIDLAVITAAFSKFGIEYEDESFVIYRMRAAILEKFARQLPILLATRLRYHSHMNKDSIDLKPYEQEILGQIVIYLTLIGAIHNDGSIINKADKIAASISDPSCKKKILKEIEELIKPEQRFENQQERTRELDSLNSKIYAL